jgi:outer membrane protein TolC
MKLFRTSLRAACLIGILLSEFVALHAAPPDKQAQPADVLPPPPPPMHITIEEAKERALSNNKLLNIGSMNVESKAYAVKVAKSNYFPHVVGTSVFLHFNDDLGTVLATQGRTVTGPRGTPLVTLPATAIDLPVLNQNSEFSTVTAIQPLTDLFKVKQGVEIARADQAIAQAQLEQGIRKVASGTEQLYWALLFVRKIQAGAQEAVAGAEQLAQLKTVEARLALVEARQGLQAANKQAADLEEQLNALLDLPLCTHLELVEPALPELPFHCVDDVVAQALANSPELAEDSATIGKAHAAVKAGKLDYVPSVAIVGGYLNQTGMDYVQQNVGFIGVMGSYTFVDWGKRRNTIRERQMLESMASLKLSDTEDKIRQKVAKTFRELIENQEALKMATEMAELRKEAEKSAKTPKDMMAAVKDRMTADVDAIKADLAYRQSVVQLMNLIGH